ncbi:hypothetical protein DLM77_10735 [Leptospira yasudae]|uniref:Uncharacterized protein n=1 Tax=Leptospira yasudae TaxID=2202201 RepID=A0ABX9M3Y6_9LEPT|nr:hypothetical protein DLM77_10735 [Leptospira yasudae]
MGVPTKTTAESFRKTGKVPTRLSILNCKPEMFLIERKICRFFPPPLPSTQTRAGRALVLREIVGVPTISQNQSNFK